MNLYLSDIQQLSCEQLYDVLLPITHKIYLSFKYIGISEEDFRQIVLKQIIKSKELDLDGKFYTNFIKISIKNELEKITQSFINNPDTSFNILNNYINQKFNNITNYYDSLNCFKKLNDFIITYKYKTNIDIFIELINKNSIFNKMVEIIFERYQTQIESNNIEESFSDDLLLLSINAYCIKNNIELVKLDDFSELTSSSTLDSIKIYLNEISIYPFLSEDEEKELAKKIAKGDKEAKKLFIESNLRLVVKIAKQFVGRGLDFLELIQEGNIGLMKAIDRYDVEKGYRFSTYATYWIRQSIIRTITNKVRNVRIPVYKFQEIVKYNQKVEELEKELNRPPTINEISKKMKISFSEAIELHNFGKDTISINNLVGEEKDIELGNFIILDEESPEDKAILSDLKFRIIKLLKESNLSQIQIDILILKFGFGDNDPMTFDEIGKIIGISGRSTQKLEINALRKLRNSECIKNFAVYMDNPEKFMNNTQKNIYNNVEEKMKNKMISIPIESIYTYFYSYTKSEVDEAIDKLSSSEKNLLTIRYGKDFEHPIKTILTKNQLENFYLHLIPKMNELLEYSLKKESIKIMQKHNNYKKNNYI